LTTVSRSSAPDCCTRSSRSASRAGRRRAESAPRRRRTARSRPRPWPATRARRRVEPAAQPYESRPPRRCRSSASVPLASSLPWSTIAMCRTALRPPPCSAWCRPPPHPRARARAPARAARARDCGSTPAVGSSRSRSSARARARSRIEPPLHAAAPVLDRLRAAVGETDARQHRVGALVQRPARQAVDRAEKRRLCARRGPRRARAPAARRPAGAWRATGAPTTSWPADPHLAARRAQEPLMQRSWSTCRRRWGRAGRGCARARTRTRRRRRRRVRRRPCAAVSTSSMGALLRVRGRALHSPSSSRNTPADRVRPARRGVGLDRPPRPPAGTAAGALRICAGSTSVGGSGVFSHCSTCFTPRR